MKFVIISAVLFYVSMVGANVVVNSVNVDEQQAVVSALEGERQSEVVIPPVSDVNEAPKTCKNVTVHTQDCQAIIVTRLPFLFNFRLLNNVCSCEDKQLKCQGAGRNFFERFQIPAMRTVYNLNCKCKCPSLVDSVVGTTVASV